MHPFASHLIAFLCGGLVSVLFVSRFTEQREIAAFAEGRQLEKDAQALRDSARAQKAARTRKERKA